MRSLSARLNHANVVATCALVLAALILLASSSSADAALIGPPPQAKLHPPGVSVYGMAASKDGRTVVTSGTPGKGNLFVWVRGTASWAGARSVKLRRPAGADFSYADVAVSANGSTVVADTETGDYVFARPSGGWSSAARSVSLGKRDGVVVGVTGGGKEIFVDEENPRRTVRYRRSSRLKYRRFAVPGLPRYYYARAVSDDGRALVVVGETAQGLDFTKLFVRPKGAPWSKASATKLSIDYVGGDGGDLDQPSDVALSRHGDTIVVGLGTSQGKRENALVFVKPTSGWRPTAAPAASLTAESPQSNGDVPEGLGGRVAISSDGSEIVAGTQHGTRVLLFRRALDGWHDQHETEQWNLPAGVEGADALAWSGPTQTMFVKPCSCVPEGRAVDQRVDDRNSVFVFAA